LTLVLHKQSKYTGPGGENPKINNIRAKWFFLKYVKSFTRNRLSSKTFTIPVVSEWDCEVKSSDSTQAFLASPRNRF
jgi:hypothetical protein